jgi:hypothetical protein
MAWTGPLSYAHSNVTVLNTSTEVVPADPDHVNDLVRIYNIGTEMVYLKVGAAAVVGEGIPVNPVDAEGRVGDPVEFSKAQDNSTREAINGICAAGAGASPSPSYSASPSPSPTTATLLVTIGR